MSATTYYAAKYKVDNPDSRWLEENSITLPCYSGVDANLVGDSIRDALAAT
jgi:hypothetical protein